MKTVTLALAAVMLLPTLARADEPADKARAKDEIWALEQSIYAGRASGDMSAYLNNVASGYLAWAPQAPHPTDASNLKKSGGAGGVPATSKEKLTMTFVDLAYHGDTAVIYYTTYRTQRFDGSPAQDHFETTHTWVKESGKWHVLGGMARPTPTR